MASAKKAGDDQNMVIVTCNTGTVATSTALLATIQIACDSGSIQQATDPILNRLVASQTVIAVRVDVAPPAVTYCRNFSFSASGDVVSDFASVSTTEKPAGSLPS